MDRILFVGLGGAGQRHLRIFRSLLPNTDFYAFRRNKKTPLLNSDFTVDIFDFKICNMIIFQNIDMNYKLSLYYFLI